MNIFRKFYCRVYQTIFQLYMPLLPYRTPTILSDYDEILKSLYGDYMQLPPEEDRYNHITENLDFGPY